MTIVGALATFIYVTTILTVALGIAAYVLYKWRERKRSRVVKPKIMLTYFVEYALPGAPAMVIPTEERRSPTSVRVAVSLGAAAALVVALIGGIWMRLRGTDTPAPATAEARTMPNLKALAYGAPSLFPYHSLDTNGDGIVEEDERLRIHAEIPQFIMLSCDDNGSVAGLEWLRATLSAHHAAGKMTYFMTGNYLEGHPNYMGGPVDDWWQVEATESYVGLHGTTHEAGGDGWNMDRWTKELSTVHQDMARKLAAPPGWTWDGYPWGSRAPFLVVDDAYFSALETLRPRVIYDSSLVVRPLGAHVRASDARDIVWPFTLEDPLVQEVDTGKARIGRHVVWEVPVYAWLLGSSWQPSLDFNLFKSYPCSGTTARDDAALAIMDNLRAHTRGNRAPFHIGLHAQNYAADKVCERATLARLLHDIDKLIRDGANVRFIAMPELLEWMEQHGHAEGESP